MHLPDYRLLLFGAVMVLMMLYRPQGLLGSRAEKNGDACTHDALLETRGLSKTFGGLKPCRMSTCALARTGSSASSGPTARARRLFFNCLSGIYRPDGGGIWLGDREITGLAPHQISKLGISRTFQNIRLFPEMSVLENVLVAQFQHRSVSPLPLLLRSKRFCNEEKISRDEAMDFWSSWVSRSMPMPFPSNLAYGLPAPTGNRPRAWRRNQRSCCSDETRRRDESTGSRRDGWPDFTHSRPWTRRRF